MDENMNLNQNSENQTPIASPYDIPGGGTAAAPNTIQPAQPKPLKKIIKGKYNWACSAILFFMLFSSIIAMIGGMVISIMETPAIMAENPDISQAELAEKLTEAMTNSDGITIVTMLASAAGVILTFIIIYNIAKPFKLKAILQKSQTGTVGVILAAFATLSVQSLSMFVQIAVITITGYTGVNEHLAQSTSFTDNMVSNVIMLLYIVIIAPVFEELIYRGIALNCFNAVNRTFAVIASSLIFALMHANFNQIFNGFLLGLVFAYIAMKSKSIIPAIICHIVANAHAMALSFAETKLMEILNEEKVMTFELIYMAVILVTGVVCAVFMIRKLGKVNSEDFIAKECVYEVEQAEAKKLTWKLLFTSPTFIISAIICIFSAVSMITAVTL